MADTISIVWNDARLIALLQGPSGPVAHDLEARGLRVESQAKRNATARPGPMVVTGRLRDSISHRLGEDSKGVYCDIGTNVTYGRFLELGTVNMPPYPFLKPALVAAK